MSPKVDAHEGADTGPLRASLKERGILAHVPLMATSNAAGGNLYKAEDFAYDPERQTVT